MRKGVKQKHFMVHSLLGKVFLEGGEKYFYDNKYVVNHIDEDKGNNILSNLEWVTYKQNTRHSIGKKVAQIDYKTNEVIKVFDTITDAYVSLNRKRTTVISKVCNNESGRKSFLGYKWKWIV